MNDDDLHHWSSYRIRERPPPRLPDTSGRPSEFNVYPWYTPAPELDQDSNLDFDSLAGLMAQPPIIRTNMGTFEQNDPMGNFGLHNAIQSTAEYDFLSEPLQSDPQSFTELLANIPSLSHQHDAPWQPGLRSLQPVMEEQSYLQIGTLPDGMGWHEVGSTEFALGQTMRQIQQEEVSWTTYDNLSQTLLHNSDQTPPHSLFQTYPYDFSKTLPHNSDQTLPHSLFQIYPHDLNETLPHNSDQAIPSNLFRAHPHNLNQTLPHSLNQTLPHNLDQTGLLMSIASGPSKKGPSSTSKSHSRSKQLSSSRNKSTLRFGSKRNLQTYQRLDPKKICYPGFHNSQAELGLLYLQTNTTKSDVQSPESCEKARPKEPKPCDVCIHCKIGKRRVRFFTSSIHFVP